MKLLALDTASGQCSVALLLEGAMITREVATARDHAKLILPMVQSLLAEAGVGLAGLDAIAFGRGPGSFTGLRIAASVTQGLAFGADLPVLPVSDLRALALQALTQVATPRPPQRVLACMDARMQEVYWALYEASADGQLAEAHEQVSAPSALVAAALPYGASAAGWVGAGRGLEAYANGLAVLGMTTSHLLPLAEPHAREVALLGSRQWLAGEALPAEAAIPVYLRDNVAQSPRP